MKLLTVVLALAATALATPLTPPPTGCKPATYACAKNPTTNAEGWKVCDVMRNWVYAGDCPPNTACKFNPINQSPYCLPK